MSLHYKAAPPLLFAELFDGVRPDGSRYFNPDRFTIEDVAERERIAKALYGGDQVFNALKPEFDILSPADEPRWVLLAYSTDGNYVWPVALAYYTMLYGLSPDPDFYAYLKKNDYELPVPEVTAELMDSVYALFKSRRP